MASSPSALTVIRGNSAAWPLQSYTTAGPAAAGLFDGSETLSAEVFHGDDAVLATPSVGWIDAPSGQYLVGLSAVQSRALAAGGYTMIVAATRGGAVVATLLEVTLIVEPAPTDGPGTLRALAQPADFLALVPEQVANPAVAAALQAATRTIEAYCRRPLVLADFDATFRPGRTRRLWLREKGAWPVQQVASLTTDLATAGMLTNQEPRLNQSATVTMRTLPGAAPGDPPARVITLSRVASGVAASADFALSDFATIADLTAAISAAGGGWTATSPGSAGTSNGPDASLLPPDRLLWQPATSGALGRAVELRVYRTEITEYLLDAEAGCIELTEARPEAFRYPDRSYATAYGSAWGGAAQPLLAGVRCRWRGGYASRRADLALGCEPVPDDLVAACCLTAQAILSAGPLAGVIKSQSSGTRKYELRADASTLPVAVKPLLTRYLSFSMGGWGQ